MTTTFSAWKNPIMSVLLVFAACMSTWLIMLSKQHHATDANNIVVEPDSYMEGVIATIMNKDGAPSLKIQSPKMIHYAQDNTTYIMQPHVTIFRQSPQPWYVDSDFGKALNGIEHIIFSSHVVIHHPDDIASPNTVMQTASLDVFPNQQQAKTSEAVTITQPDVVVHAIGMLANLEDGTVQLLSQAKGDYVPTS